MFHFLYCQFFIKTILPFSLFSLLYLALSVTMTVLFHFVFFIRYSISDLPGLPHFVEDSRILKTIVVSPPHVMNLYESPTLTTIYLQYCFSLVSGARLFVTATFLLSVYLAVVRILTLRFRCANFAFRFNRDCFWLAATFVYI